MLCGLVFDANFLGSGICFSTAHVHEPQVMDEQNGTNLENADTVLRGENQAVLVG
jgi:hypothetical protein